MFVSGHCTKGEHSYTCWGIRFVKKLCCVGFLKRENFWWRFTPFGDSCVSLTNLTVLLHLYIVASILHLNYMPMVNIIYSHIFIFYELFLLVTIDSSVESQAAEIQKPKRTGSLALFFRKVHFKFIVIFLYFILVAAEPYYIVVVSTNQ